MNKAHTPNPEFVNHLEWELKSIIRRQESTNGTPYAARRIRPRSMTMLALAIVSMFIGGAGTYAATRSIDGRAAALYIARAEAMLEIAQTQLQHFTSELSRVQGLAEQGLITQRELRQVEAQYVDAEAETETRRLDLDETTLSGKAPNDALSAPLVGGRDFVTQRMNARRRPMQLRLDVLNDEAQRIQKLADTGVATERELKTAQMPMLAATGELAELEQRVELRASFLTGELSAKEVELEGMRRTAETARQAAAHHVELLAEQHKRMADLSERGMVSNAELQKAEAALLTASKQVELADLELRIIDEKLTRLTQNEKPPQE